MAHTHDILLEPAAIAGEVGRLAAVAEALAQHAARYTRALHAAAHGDPRGYLAGGIDDGYAALAAARQAEADLHEVVRRIQATLHAVTQHDQAAQASAALRTLPGRELPVVSDIALPTDTVASATITEAVVAIPCFDTPASAPVVPVPPHIEPSALTVGTTPVVDDLFISPVGEPAIPVLGTLTIAPERVPEPVSQPAVVLLSPVAIITPPMLPPTAPPNNSDAPWWQRAWDSVSGFFAGIIEWIGDLLKGVYDMLSLYLSNLSKGDWVTWGLTILGIVVVVILALTGVLEVAALIVGVLLAVVGVIVSVIAIIGNVQQMQVDPEMSDYDKGRLTGRSFMDVLSAIASGAGALKLGRAAQVANDLRGLGAMGRAGATVSEMLNEGYKAEQILAWANKAGQTGAALRGLLGEGVEVSTLLKAGASVDDLLAAGAEWEELFAAGVRPEALSPLNTPIRSGARTGVDLFNLETAPNSKTGQVLSTPGGKAPLKEVSFADQIATREGKAIVLTEGDNTPSIDAFYQLDGQPIQLKTVESANPTKIIDRIQDTYKKALTADKNGAWKGLELDIEAPTLTRAEVLGRWKGSDVLSTRLLNIDDGTIDRIIVYCSDGIIELPLR